MNTRYAFGLIAVALFGAGIYTWHGQSQQGSVPECANCNVIVIGLDAWQAAHVSHLGYERDTTPTLDALAKKGYTFSQAISASSWTVPSFMSIFTGTFPTIHKVTNKFVKFSYRERVLTDSRILSPEIATLAEFMKQHGYDTAGFTGDAGVSGAFGYSRGFDTYVDDVKFGGFGRNVESAVAWIEQREREKKPFFMFFHGYDAHGQFDLPTKYTSRYADPSYHAFRGTKQEQESLRERGLAGEDLNLSDADVAFWRAWYDGKLHDGDAQLDRFIRELRSKGVLDNTILVLVGDHGTESYEHKRFDHGHSLYDELVHVPLVIVTPGGKKNTRIDSQVSTIDVFPTIIELLGMTPGKTLTSQLQGTSLVPLLKGEKLQQDAYLETDYRNFVHLRGVRTADGYKYIKDLSTGREELYDLKSDPHEMNNIATGSPETLTRLQKLVDEHVAAMGVVPKFSEDCLPVYDSQCR